MERKKNYIRQLINYFIPVFYLIGIIIHFSLFGHPLLKVLTPVALLSINFLIIIFGFPRTKGAFSWLILSYSFSFVIEVIGASTGLIFGVYYYGEGLGLKLLNVPLIIGLNWIIVVAGASLISEKLISTKFKYILTGLLAVIFDLVLEHIAPTLDYWHWKDGIIPFKNFVSWFFIAVILHFAYDKLSNQKLSNLFLINLISQFLFFVVLLLWFR